MSIAPGIAAAETPPESRAGTPTVASAERPARWPTLLSLAGLAVYVALCPRAIRWLARVENGPDPDGDRIMGWLNAGGLVSAAALIASAAAGMSRAGMVRGPSRFAAWAVAGGAFLWFAPVPFGVQRYLIVLVWLIAAGLYAAALVRMGLRLLRRGAPGVAAAPGWEPGIALLGAVAGSAMAVMMLKMNEMGWGRAID